MLTCSTNESYINSKILANYFSELCKNFVPPYRVDCVSVNSKRTETNLKVTNFLSQLKRLTSEDKCHFETLKTDIENILKKDVIHLEILWYLDIYKFASVTDILRHHERVGNANVVGHICNVLFRNILNFKTDASTVRRRMTVRYVKAIFDIPKSECNEDKVSCSFQRTLLDLISTNFNEFYKSQADGSYFLDDSLDLPVLFEVLNLANVGPLQFQFIFHTITNSLLIGLPQTIKNIFMCQEKNKNKAKGKKIYDFFTDVSKYYDVDELMTDLRDLLLEKTRTVNWHNVMTLITFIGVTYKDGWRRLKNLCDLILVQAFKNLDVKLLGCAFALARQCCFEKPRTCFPSYLQWFGSSFSTESSSPLKTKECCTLFFNFLTDLVPVDCVYYLKVHINRPPWVGLEHQSYLDEYTSLVKNQLHDLNASTDLGICENSTNKSAAAFDVENVLKHFQETNTILNSVFEASMFRKSYFEKKFLPELLSKFDGKTSPRHKLIMKLNSLKKIPKASLKKYENIQSVNSKSK